MLLWATDLHLNYFSDEYIINFAKSIKEQYKSASGLIISGDISIGTRLEKDLKNLLYGIQLPIYYVLGNHDYWYLSFNEIDKICSNLDKYNGLFNLNKCVIDIGDDKIISGFNGWYDCRLGSINNDYFMNDWVKILDFANKNPIEISQNRSFLSFGFKERILKNDYINKNIIVVTHFPPFKTLIKNKNDIKCYYGSSDSGLILNDLKPFFKKIICLCGHTHSKAKLIKDNLYCYVGEACRGKPSISGFVDTNKFTTSFF